MRVGYFVNQYPKVSHSFIRREILAHEAAGLAITRYALRTDPDELVDEADKHELEKCRYVLREKPSRIAACIFSELAANPKGFLKAGILAVRIGWRSDRGLLRHLLYWGEAAVLAHWCRDDGVDHLHAHFGTNSAAIAMLAHQMTGIPYSFTVHGPEEFDKPQFLGLTEKVRHAAFVVAVSSFGRSQLYRWADRRDWDKIRVIHCGIETSFYAGETPPPPSAPRLVCVARISEQKGIAILIHAARRLFLGEVDFEIVIVGDGPMRRDIESMIRHYELGEKISITGWQDAARVREEILNARALVLPSFAEGLPVVIMEAMALRRPVISTYIAGIPELVTPGESGWLVPAGDVPGLARAMRDALEAPAEKLSAMGTKAKDAVLGNHDITAEAAKLRDAILSVHRSSD